MSESAPEQEQVSYSQEEVSTAELQEQAVLNEAQKTFLVRRVVLQRVENTRLKAELAEAQHLRAVAEMQASEAEAKLERLGNGAAQAVAEH